MRYIITALAVLMLCYAPVSVSAQQATSTPPDPNNTSLIVVLIGAVGAILALVVELARRYVNGRIDLGIERERTRLTTAVKRDETESSIRLETIQADREERRSDADALRSLAGSLDNVAKSNQAFAQEVSSAYKYLASDREQAAREREEFRVIQGETNKELAKQATELATLASEMKKFSQTGDEILMQIREIRERIGGEKDEPALTKLIGEATKAAKNASEALERAAAQGGGQPSPEMGNATDAMQAASDAIGLVGAADQRATNIGDTQAPPPASDVLHVGDTIKIAPPDVTAP